MTLRIILTGGTFDKHYDALAGELTFAETHLTEIVTLCRLTVEVVIETVVMIDSLDMLPEHRERVLASCLNAAETSLVVIHGTDTMEETAAVLGPGLAKSQKRVVLTGAMVPYEVRGSDALFNLGFAFAAAQLAPPGVYVAMNGRLFDWHRVRKNRAEGKFEVQSQAHQ
jgi:L-asparaginase